MVATRKFYERSTAKEDQGKRPMRGCREQKQRMVRQAAMPMLEVSGEQQRQVPDETGDEGRIQTNGEEGRPRTLGQEHRPYGDTRTIGKGSQAESQKQWYRFH